MQRFIANSRTPESWMNDLAWHIYCFGSWNHWFSEGQSTYTSQQVKKNHVIPAKPGIQALPVWTYLITRKLAFYCNGRLIKNMQNWLGGSERRQRRLPAPENLSQFSKIFKSKHLLGFFTGWETQHCIMKFLHSEVENHRYFPWKFPFWFLRVQCITQGVWNNFDQLWTEMAIRCSKHLHEAQMLACITFHSSLLPASFT